MTLPEFFGCAMVAFGPPLAMFVFTVAHDPLRIIILIVASFFWMLSLLLSSITWYIVMPLRGIIAFGALCSVLYQESFRYFIYRILRRTEQGLQIVAEDTRVTENKHILSYVSGLGFGVISSMFALVNVLADMWGPGTLGLKGGNETFFLTSAIHALCICLLHTFWSVIYFNAFDTSNYVHIAYVVGSHLLVCLSTLFNVQEMYLTSLLANYSITFLTALIAFNVAGGTMRSFKRFVTCQ